MAPAVGAWSALGAAVPAPALVSGPSPTASTNPSLEDRYALSEAIGREDPSYAMAAAGDGYALSNATNQYQAVVDAGGLRVESGADAWSLSVLGVGYGGNVTALGSAVATAAGNRVDYDYGGVSQWFVNGPLGLQQGFTLAERPAGGDGPLTVDLAMGGSLTATADAGGRSVTLARADGSAAMSYGGLIAYDATGRETPAYFSVHSTADGDVLSIQVDDADAVYPLVIDPYVQQQPRLTGQGSQQFMFFGYSVSISGDGTRAAIGARNENVGSLTGAGVVYVFDRVGSSWTRTARLTATDGRAGDQLGYSVSISLDGTTVAAGAAAATVGGAPERGAVYVFAKPGGTWSQVDKLIADGGLGGDFLGSSVSISGNGDAIAAGANSATVAGNEKQGAAYVFTRLGGHSWSQTATLLADDGVANDAFGTAIAISADGGSLAATSPTAKVNGKAGQGAVYVFDKVATGWSRTAKLSAADGAANDMLGMSVAISSDGAVVLAGAPYAAIGGKASQGAAYVFERIDATWILGVKLKANAGAAGDLFGSSASISADGTTALVGAPNAKIGSNPNQGAAYVFGKPGGAWTETDRLVATGGGVNDFFGNAVAASLDGSTVMIGAQGSNIGGTPFQGTAYGFANPKSPVASISPGSRTVTVGTPTTFTAATATPNATVRWQVSTSVGAWTDIPGETKSWYTVTPTLADSGTRYRAVVTAGGKSATTASAQLTVVKPGVVLRISSNVNPRRLGDPLNITVNATAAVPGTGIPNGGTITVNIGPKTYSGTLLNGLAIFAVEPLGLGTYAATATYDGARDPIFGSATATMTQVVVRGTTTMTGDVPTFAAVGQPVTLKTELTFAGTGVTPIGGVVINDGGQPIRFEQIRSEGGKWVASYTTSALTPGDHYIRFIYLGEAMAEPARTDQIFHLVVGAGGAQAAAANAGGQGTPGSPPSAAPNQGASAPPSGGLVQPEAGIPPVGQTATAGIATTFTAAPTDPANATAQWQVSAAGGGAWANIPGATNWWYTLTPTMADSGKRYRAIFSGGGGAPETTAPAQLTVVKAGVVLRISSDVNPRRLGDPLNLIVDATSAILGAGVPDGGTITVNIGPKSYSGTLHDDGKAIFAVAPLGLGTYAATATYDGARDPIFGSATAAMTQVVVRGTTTMTGDVPTFAAVGQPVTLKTVLNFEATGATPIGGVMINDGGQPIRFEQIRLEGGQWVASFTTSALTPGDHYIRFIYLGEAMAEPARTDQIFHLVIGGAAASRAGDAAAAPFAALAGSASRPGGSRSLPQPDMAGVAAALAIAEATRQKPASAFEPSSNQAAAPRTFALPNALTARRFQQRLGGASGAI